MISGERVRQARELREWTQIELAERLRVNQSTIASIENGRLTPSVELLEAVSLLAGFPPSFFKQDPSDDFPLGSLLLFRARTSASVRKQAQAYRYAQITYECAHKLAHFIKPIPMRLPQLADTPEVAAAVTRTALGLSPDTPILHLVHSLERAGVHVLALPVIVEGIDAFSQWTGTNFDEPVISVLQTEAGDRLRFSIAHEVGHLVMHQSIRGGLSDIEREADRFAGRLLLPEAAMRAEVLAPVTLTSLATLKTRWRTSIQALIMRAHELEIITDRQKKYLFQQLSARGWRKREPGSLNIPVEKPRAFRQMAEILYGLPIDYHRLATDVRLSETLLRDILDMHAGKAQATDTSIVPFRVG